jgi:mannitol-1-phosphate/altronate dehydrogenase
MAIEELTYMEKSVIALEQDCDRLIAQIIKTKKVIKKLAASGREDGMNWLKDQMKFVSDEVDRMVGE